MKSAHSFVVSILIVFTLLALYACAEAPVPEGFEPFVRIDGNMMAARSGDVASLRLITKGMYSLQEPTPRYEMPDLSPDTSGLDTLNISGSGEFSEQQFLKLAETLRLCADGKDIYIIDLRRESHALLNGISFSWYGFNNWSNIGLSAEEIEDDQNQRFGALVGQALTAYPYRSTYQVKNYQSEKELVESQGFNYVRIPVLDHSWPEPEEVDTFVELVKSIDMDRVWLHFHCAAGKGRTGTFMFMYDKMKNPKVERMDLMVRQAKLGSTYMLYSGAGDSFREMLYTKRSMMALLFCDYVDENLESCYAVKWSDWLANQDPETPMNADISGQ